MIKLKHGIVQEFYLFYRVCERGQLTRHEGEGGALFQVRALGTVLAPPQSVPNTGTGRFLE